MTIRPRLRARAKPNVAGAGFETTTNWKQTDNKVATEVETNWKQSDNKLAADDGYKKPSKQQTDNKVASQPATEVETNWKQTDNKAATNGTVQSLIGLQRKLLFFLFENCKVARSNTTGPVTISYLSELSNSPTGSVKVTLQRLEKKQLIVRQTFKNGRGGWTIYEIPDFIYNVLLKIETDNKLATNRKQTDNKVASQPATEPTTSSSSSSSVNLNNKTTTTSEFQPELIDASPLEEFGFSINQVKQCLERNWGFDKHPIELQQSIFHLRAAIDLGILAIPKGPGLIIEQLKRGKYHAPNTIRSKEIESAKEKSLAWWDNIPMENRMEIQKNHNFDRMKNNDEKRAKILELYNYENASRSLEVPSSGQT